MKFHIPRSNNPWSLGNKNIYDLCRTYPKHINEHEIIAKIWIIGRTYAAAIERRKPKDNIDNDKFYVEKVAPKIMKKQIDNWFNSIKSFSEISSENFEEILKIHYKLTALFEEITNLQKRSLSSKYLHFHFPDLFFIYDTRSVKAMRKLVSITRRANRISMPVDNEYRKFCEKCLTLRGFIKKTFGKSLSPRQLDNLLLSI